MTDLRTEPPASVHESFGVLLDLNRRARRAADRVELAFIAVNDTHQLTPYRQAALWLNDGGVHTVSGVVQVEANAPYVQWLDRVCRTLAKNGDSARVIGAADLSSEEAAEWDEWLPAHGLWLPLAGTGGWFLARDHAWTAQEIALASEWADTWTHSWRALAPRRAWSWRQTRLNIAAHLKWNPQRRWWQQRAARWAIAILALLLMPVRLTVLAPGELVPANPAVIRAPLEGVIASFAVRPNDTVQVGQSLFNFDDAPLASRLTVASQSLATALAEYRQAAQLAVSETKSKAQLAMLSGKIEERKAEAEYLRGQLERAHVVAPVAGIALFDDPSEWIGKPVVTGERIMRIAAPDDVEIEAWLAVGDAIPLANGAHVKLYLNASPLSPVTATLRYVAHDAVQRPDGSYAYRVRAKLDGVTMHHVGLKGTAKLSGAWVPAIYWMLRRPLAALRQAIGW